MNSSLPPVQAPQLLHLTRVVCEVGAVVSLGGPAKHGERRYVPILSGTAAGPELNGELLQGGVDWQVQRADGVTDISAHYVIRTPDGALVEVQSDGLRHGPPEVMARLARGEPVPPQDYFFRTWVRLTTGHPDWLHLNKVMALAVGQREQRRVILDFWRIA
ncbi:MAG: DUF3237 domain-containing protein [Rubrivivax sp.]|nr:DUF3237 domain-containing protein [Rubrivivax sp.]MDP3224640.1 DUF3237 domain-containing protein [Rubrivivax sp.]